MTEDKKSLLIVLRQAPYGGQAARESLDAILTAAAFEQPLSLLFIDDGVYQLLADQQPQQIEAKNLAATLPVLPMYDVEHIYADEHSLQQRQIDSVDCLLPVKPLTLPAVQKLFAEHEVILSF